MIDEEGNLTHEGQLNLKDLFYSYNSKVTYNNNNNLNKIEENNEIDIDEYSKNNENQINIDNDIDN